MSYRQPVGKRGEEICSGNMTQLLNNSAFPTSKVKGLYADKSISLSHVLTFLFRLSMLRLLGFWSGFLFLRGLLRSINSRGTPICPFAICLLLRLWWQQFHQGIIFLPKACQIYWKDWNIWRGEKGSFKGVLIYSATFTLNKRAISIIKPRKRKIPIRSIRNPILFNNEKYSLWSQRQLRKETNTIWHYFRPFFHSQQPWILIDDGGDLYIRMGLINSRVNMPDDYAALWRSFCPPQNNKVVLQNDDNWKWQVPPSEAIWLHWKSFV